MTRHEIIEKLLSEMKEQGITQRKLSEMTGLHQPFLSKMFTKHIFSFDTLEKVCRALNLKICLTT